MNIEDYRQGIVDWVNNQAGDNPNTIAKGNTFCQWCLENIFELSTEQALDAQEMAGSYDYNIDAFIMYEENSATKIIVVQTKYENAHDFSETIKFHYLMKRIKEEKVQEFEANEKAARVIVDIQDAYHAGWDVKYFYVTNTQFTDSDRIRIQQMDGNNIDFFFYDLNDIVHRLDSRQQDVPDSIKDKWFNLKLATKEMLTFADKTAVVAVSLAHMHDFVDQGSNDLFASNVRQYLRGTRINTAIKDTILKSPDTFWLYNNGITIVCDDFSIVDADSSIQIRTPQIVNGCQTAQSIWEVLSKKHDKERRQLRGHVLVRVIKGADEKEKELITRYTNSQNAVRGKDFFSLEEFQKKLQDKFSKVKYYYERQKGSFTALKPSQRVKYTGIPELAYLVESNFKNRIPAMEAAQAYAAAFKQIPNVAYGQPYDLTPGGSSYDEIFDDSTPQDPRYFLYPFLVREWAKKNDYSRGGETWRAHSSLFFVYSYFVVLIEMLKQQGSLDQLAELPSEINMDIYSKIFYDSQVNQEILLLTDDILERYFQDSRVSEAVGLDVRKFLKSADMLQRHKTILMNLIHNVIASSRNRKVVEALSSVLVT